MVVAPSSVLFKAKSPPLRILLPALSLGFVSCVGTAGGSDSGAMQDAAREALQRRMDKGEERLQLTTFNKTNEIALQRDGARAYRFMFDATATFRKPAYWNASGGFSMEPGIRTYEYRQMPALEYMSFGPGTHTAKRGDVLRISGEILLEQTKAGWLPSETEFKAVLDSTSRK